MKVKHERLAGRLATPSFENVVPRAAPVGLETLPSPTSIEVSGPCDSEDLKAHGASAKTDSAPRPRGPSAETAPIPNICIAPRLEQDLLKVSPHWFRIPRWLTALFLLPYTSKPLGAES